MYMRNTFVINLTRHRTAPSKWLDYLLHHARDSQPSHPWLLHSELGERKVQKATSAPFLFAYWTSREQGPWRQSLGPHSHGPSTFYLHVPHAQKIPDDNQALPFIPAMPALGIVRKHSLRILGQPGLQWVRPLPRNKRKQKLSEWTAGK